MRAYAYSYFVLLCHVWLTLLGGLLFSVGEGLGGGTERRGQREAAVVAIVLEKNTFFKITFKYICLVLKEI